MKTSWHHTTGWHTRRRLALGLGLGLLCAASAPAFAAGAALAELHPPTVPGPPTGVTAIAGNASVAIQWLPPADDGGSPITSYSVTTQGPDPRPSPMQAFGTATSIRGLTNGVTYTFVVAAQNLVGTGVDSMSSNRVIPVTVPGPPTSVAARANAGSVTISWSPPAENGGSAITAYTVTTSLDGEAVKRIILPAWSTSTDVDVTGGFVYTFAVSAASAVGSGPASDPVGARSRGPGYWMLGVDGQVYPFGDARSLGDPRGDVGTALAVDLEPTPSGNGYWVVDDRGRVYAYGDAVRRGNLKALVVGERATSLSATPSGAGYWIFTSRGRAVPYGDASFHGDLWDVKLNGPVRDSVATPTGEGYYLVASDGGIFAFGDAAFYGSMGGTRLNAPVISLVPDADGRGYWLAASDGGIFAFDAAFRGSMGAKPLIKPITAMVRFGAGYLMAGSDGGVFNFSDRPFLGSLGAAPPGRPIVAAAALCI